MKKTNGNINKFLKDNPNETGVSESHQSYLGLKTPKDYFSTSKSDILNSIKGTEQRKNLKINSRRIWSVAAAVALLITVSVIWLKDDIFNKADQIVLSENGFDEASDNILLSSLFVEDSETDAYINDCFLAEVASELEEIEKSSESVIINSLLVDDSLADEFIENYLIEEVIL